MELHKTKTHNNIFKFFVKCNVSNDDLPHYIKNPMFHAINEYDEIGLKGEPFLIIFFVKSFYRTFI